jgi:hypothetical protein
MGVSVHVSGIIPADETYLKMLNILNACKDAKISVPPEVDKFFGGYTNPDPKGMVVRLKDEDCCEGNVEYEGGMLIDIEAIPSNIKFIRVEMS